MNGEDLRNETSYFPDFSMDCVIGVDINGRCVYSFEKMVQYLTENGMTDVEAVEYVEYDVGHVIPYIDNRINVAKGYSGRPVIMYTREWLGA